MMGQSSQELMYSMAFETLFRFEGYGFHVEIKDDTLVAEEMSGGKFCVDCKRATMLSQLLGTDEISVSCDADYSACLTVVITAKKTRLTKCRDCLVRKLGEIDSYFVEYMEFLESR